MSVYVLLHGAWQGAATWDLIVPQLRAAGHAVYVPLLTGLRLAVDHATTVMGWRVLMEDGWHQGHMVRLASSTKMVKMRP